MSTPRCVPWPPAITPPRSSRPPRGLACWRHISSHQRPEALLHRLLGRAHAGLGHHQQAAAHLDTALAIFTDLGERYNSARTQYYIATTHLASNPGPAETGEAIT